MRKKMRKIFTELRSFFFPIQKFELKKVLPMFLMFFFFYFIHVVLKDIKEPLVVTAPGGSAECIAFLKLWGTLPLALLFMLIYTKLANRLSKKALFCSIITFLYRFMCFLLLFYIP